MNRNLVSPPKRKARNFLPNDFSFTSWEDLQPYTDNLLNREIDSLAALEKLITDSNEFGEVIGEDMRWRMIKMTCNTQDEAITEAYQFVVTQISPKLTTVSYQTNQKMVQSPFFKDLDKTYYFTFLRDIESSLALFREENIPLKTQARLKAKEYTAKMGSLMVNIDGEEKTMQQAGQLMSDTDREIRKKAYLAISKRRLEEKESLDNLFNDLLKLRHQIAQNANFENYRDYMFASLGRFDYTPDDCFQFHQSIASEIVPLSKSILNRRIAKLNLSSYRPWDGDVDVSGKAPLKPFKNTKEIVDKTVQCLARLRPEFGSYLSIMNQMNYLDLESRPGKSPGGYNCTLPEMGVPFIFMNSVGSMRDLITMVHESGHAVHSFLSRDLALQSFKSLPSEVAELASMSMELFSMEHWDVYFDKEEDLKRAKITQLEKVISGFSWIATIDQFQHWLYTNPTHTIEERETKWRAINEDFSTHLTNWEGYEHLRTASWQRQLHIFEVPFYYIEYAMAQLGAIAMWKQYKENPQQALDNYTYALSLGYTKSIGDIYKAAGIRFDFSQNYVQELAAFVMNELNALYEEVETELAIA